LSYGVTSILNDILGLIFKKDNEIRKFIKEIHNEIKKYLLHGTNNVKSEESQAN